MKIIQTILIGICKKEIPVWISLLSSFAEREGFEPPAPLSAPVFKTGVIDHSTISPDILVDGFP